jgi:opacity protein-like surface antigen
MKKLFLAASILFATGANVLAQAPQFGVKIGGNLSTVTTTEDSEGLKSNPGFQIGVTLDYELAENVYLLSGLELVQKGFKVELEEDGLEYTLTGKPLYLQIPIHIGYKFDLGNAKFVPQVGPYLAYGLGGKATTKMSVDDVEMDMSTDVDYFDEDNNVKKLDLGLTVGAGLEIGKIGVNLGYSLGLMNIADSDDDSSVKNGSLFITVGYKF